MDNNLCNVLCPSCGIEFKFSSDIEEAWKRTEKSFYCPNGHGMSWPKPLPKEEEMKKEVKTLKEKVSTLTEALKKSEEKVQELTLELEIWHPASK